MEIRCCVKEGLDSLDGVLMFDHRGISCEEYVKNVCIYTVDVVGG